MSWEGGKGHFVALPAPLPHCSPTTRGRRAALQEIRMLQLELGKGGGCAFPPPLLGAPLERIQDQVGLEPLPLQHQQPLCQAPAPALLCHSLQPPLSLLLLFSPLLTLY